MLGNAYTILTKTRKFYKVAAYVTFLFIFSLAFLTSQASAIDLTSDVTLKRGNYKSVINNWHGSNCQTVGNYLIMLANNAPVCYINDFTLQTVDMTYDVGDYIQQDIYFVNNTNGNAGDWWTRINSVTNYPSGNSYAGLDFVDAHFENLGQAGGRVTLISRVWRAGNITTIQYGFDSYAALALYQDDSLASGYTTVWHENAPVDNTVTLGNIYSVLSNQSQQLQNIVDNTYYTHQDTATINTYVGTINGNVSDIKTLLQNELGGMTQAIEDGNQAAQDRYDDEKDTIEGGVSDGADSINGLDTDNLSIPNPFQIIIGNITPAVCYDISPLTRLTFQRDNVQYCSWFSPTVRSVLTPVFGFAATMLILGFFYSWLRKGGI